MGISVTILLLFVVIVLYIQLVDIFSILFRVSGMTKEQARFQTISLLTNSGFTTRESEIILAVPERRRIGKAAMIFGFAFSATVISLIVSTVNSPAEWSGNTDFFPLVVTISLALVIYLLLRQTPRVSAHFDRKVEQWAEKKIRTRTNTVVLLDEFRQDALIKVYMQKTPRALRDQTIKETGMEDAFGVRVVRIERGKRSYIKNIRKMMLKDGDILILLGEYRTAEELFDVDVKEPPKKTPAKKKQAEA